MASLKQNKVFDGLEQQETSSTLKGGGYCQIAMTSDNTIVSKKFRGNDMRMSLNLETQITQECADSVEKKDVEKNEAPALPVDQFETSQAKNSFESLLSGKSPATVQIKIELGAAYPRIWWTDLADLIEALPLGLDKGASAPLQMDLGTQQALRDLAQASSHLLLAV